MESRLQSERDRQQGHQRRQQQQLPQLRMRCLWPSLWPPSFEAQYWESDWCKRTAREKDKWNLFMRACHEPLFLFRFCAGVPTAAIGPLYRGCLNSTMLVAVQLALFVFHKDLYNSCRLVLVTHQRLYFFLTYVASLKAVRRAAILGIPSHHVDNALMYQVVKGTPNFRTLRALLLGSASLWPLIDALPVHAPFPLEVVMPLLYLFAAIRLVSPLSAQYFSHPRFTPDTQQFCHSLAPFVDPLSLLPPAASPAISRALLFLTPLALNHRSAPAGGPIPDPRHICDTIQHAWVLVLFFQLYVGFAIPTYLTIQASCRHKLRYMLHLHGHHQPLQPEPQAITTPSVPQCPDWTGPSTNLEPCPPSGTPPVSSATPSSSLAGPSRSPPRSYGASPAGSPSTTSSSTSAAGLAAASTPQSSPGSSLCPTPAPSRLCRHLSLACLLTGRLPQPHTAPSPCNSQVLQLLRDLPWHMLALWVLAVLMWQVAVLLHKPLARYVVPIDFVGAHTDWFWELRCGAPHPCCPAK